MGSWAHRDTKNRPGHRAKLGKLDEKPQQPCAKLSVPTSKQVLGFYLKPGGDTPGNTLLVVGGFASLVTGVCVLTGEVDAPALFEAVQAGNFWQWVVRPGGE